MEDKNKALERVGKAQRKLGWVFGLIGGIFLIGTFLIFGLVHKDWVSGIPFLVLGLLCPGAIWYLDR